MDYLISRTILSFCGWELLPLAAIALLAARFIRRRKRLMREEAELRDSIRSYENALGISRGDSAEEEEP